MKLEKEKPENACVCKIRNISCQHFMSKMVIFLPKFLMENSLYKKILQHNSQVIMITNRGAERNITHSNLIEAFSNNITCRCVSFHCIAMFASLKPYHLIFLVYIQLFFYRGRFGLCFVFALQLLQLLTARTVCVDKSSHSHHNIKQVLMSLPQSSSLNHLQLISCVPWLVCNLVR